MKTHEIEQNETIVEEEECTHDNIRVCIHEIWKRYYTRDEETGEFSETPESGKIWERDWSSAAIECEECGETVSSEYLNR